MGQFSSGVRFSSIDQSIRKGNSKCVAERPVINAVNQRGLAVEIMLKLHLKVFRIRIVVKVIKMIQRNLAFLAKYLVNSNNSRVDVITQCFALGV